MPPIYDAGRVRIKGTDPRVRAVADKIGRGTMPSGRDRMTADMQAELAGRRPSDADINDDFARRLMAQEPDYVNDPRNAAVRARRGAADTGMSPGARQLLAQMNEPREVRRYVHETDVGNVGSIREKGIRRSRGGSAMGTEGVYAYEGGAEGRRVPPGRALIEFETDAPIVGRGTMGSKAVAVEGDVAPGRITGGYGPSGRIFDAGSTTLGLMSLLGTAAQFIPGFSERMPRTSWLANGGPLGDVLNSVIAQNYAPGGIMDPYRDMRDLPGFNPQTGTVPA